MRTKSKNKERIGSDIDKLVKAYYARVGDSMFDDEGKVVREIQVAYGKPLMEKYSIPDTSGRGTKIIKLWIEDSIMRVWMRKKTKV